ncbi:MAG TPA: hypothetical protein VFI83_03350 [Gaiella sp.]|nr:hypothetical protein [Gaiella sp.]
MSADVHSTHLRVDLGRGLLEHVGLGALDVAVNEVDPVERPKKLGKGHGRDGVHLRWTRTFVHDRLPVPRGRVTDRKVDAPRSRETALGAEYRLEEVDPLEHLGVGLRGSDRDEAQLLDEELASSALRPSSGRRDSL